MSSVGFLIFDGLWREISARVNRFVRSASGRTAEKRRNLARSKMRGFLRGVPENITFVPLPSKSPELNSVENIWQYMRDNWLFNRIFANYEDILDHCCFNWNKLVERPWLIMSIGTRRWAHG